MVDLKKIFNETFFNFYECRYIFASVQLYNENCSLLWLFF